MLFLYLSPLTRASIPQGVREVMTQKRDCASSRRSAHLYSFRVIAEHEAGVLHFLLSRGTDEQERQVGRRLQERGLVDVCSHDIEYASPNAAGDFPQLPPTTRSPGA